MKKKISINIGQENVERLGELGRTTMFRNKSHVMEFALEELYKKIKHEEDM